MKVTFKPGRVWHEYEYDSHMVGMVQGYWSWAINDYSKPLFKSQTAIQHRPDRPPRVLVDVISPQAIASMRQSSLQSEVAAIQNGISLANGNGLTHEWDESTSEVYLTEPYEGSRKARNNDDRKRPVFWTKRHCRIYNV